MAGQVPQSAPAAFARTWIDAWNSHDIDRIMVLFAEGVVYRSLKALAIVGSGEVRGKDGLRQYWSKALDRQPGLRLTIEGVCAGVDMVAIVYRNQVGILGVETFYFDKAGLVTIASACHEVIQTA